MLLSQAIREGRTLRPESHQESHPFVRVINGETTDLYSDVWGAAVEAVHSPISKRDWTGSTYQSDMAAFVEIQRAHFDHYFRTPANCPGQKAQGFFKARGKVINSEGEYTIDRPENPVYKPVTSECSHILNLAEFIEHAFYVHNWSSEDCAQAVEYYEQGNQILVAQHFDHFRAESVRRSVSAKLIAAARQRTLRRHAKRTGNRVYVH